MWGDGGAEFSQIDTSNIYEYPRDARAGEGIVNPSTDEYMLKISDMPKTVLRSYVPMWKTIKSSTSSELDKMLKRWSSEIKSWDPPPKRPETHVSMSRARFHIPFDKEPEFLKTYASCVTLGVKFFLVEQLTPVFRLFVDLDIAQLAGVPENQMEAAAFIVQRTTTKFYPDIAPDDFVTMRTIVCTTTYKRVPAKGTTPELWKSGIHIHFPNLFVTRDMALNIRESCVAELEGAGDGLGKRLPPSNAWGDAFDASVYGKGQKGGGLRLPGSNKTDTCPDCNGKIRKPPDVACVLCNGEGKVDSGRPYFPLLVLQGQPAGALKSKRDFEAEATYRADFCSLIMDTKVRSTFTEPPAEPRFAIPDSAPLFISQTPTRRIKGAPGMPAPKITRGHGLPNSDAAWDALQGLIRTSWPMYAKIVIQSIKTNANRTYYEVHVSGENSRFCQNIDREHASNRIYFYATFDGISQRCHDSASQQSTEMKYGLCSSYGSGLVKIPARFSGLLFPSKTSQTPSRVFILPSDPDESENVLVFRDRKLVKAVEYLDFFATELGYPKWSSTISAADGKRYVGTSRDQSLFVDPSAIGTTASKTLRAIGLETSEEVPRSRRRLDSEDGALQISYESLTSLESNLLKAVFCWTDVYVNAIEEKTNTNPWRTACLWGVSNKSFQNLAGKYALV